jgi:thiamine biosynthesis lipoprotein
LLAACLAAFVSSHPADEPLVRQEFTQVHMGLPVRIVLHARTEVEGRGAARAAFARIAELDRMMSDYRDDSELRAVERGAGAWIYASPELRDVLRQARAIAEATGGAFDPTVAPLVALWRDARRIRSLPDPRRLSSAHALVGWRDVEIDDEAGAARLRRTGMRLDLGGIAKGYILDQARQSLAARGTTRVLLEAGGDIVVGDAPPGKKGWHVNSVGAAAAFAARAASLTRGALATSGPSAQFVEIDGVRYSHAIDPRSGMALTNGWTAMVIAPDGATADALATALTVLGPEAVPGVLARFPGVAAAVWRDELP